MDSDQQGTDMSDTAEQIQADYDQLDESRQQQVAEFAADLVKEQRDTHSDSTN